MNEPVLAKSHLCVCLSANPPRSCQSFASTSTPPLLARTRDLLLFTVYAKKLTTLMSFSLQHHLVVSVVGGIMLKREGTWEMVLNSTRHYDSRLDSRFTLRNVLLRVGVDQADQVPIRT